MPYIRTTFARLFMYFLLKVTPDTYVKIKSIYKI